MFQVVARHWELIFLLLDQPKMQRGSSRYSDVTSGRQAL